jgi:PadR family transcriptional regulator PadR
MIDYTDSEYWFSLVRMSISRYFILHALSTGPMHGYEIGKWVEEYTEGSVAPSEGALYPVLKELEQGGYVESVTQTVSGRMRKTYMLNDKGMEAYDRAVDAWTRAALLILKSRGLAE